jgi:hypothetical protein
MLCFYILFYRIKGVQTSFFKSTQIVHPHIFELIPLSQNPQMFMINPRIVNPLNFYTILHYSVSNHVKVVFKNDSSLCTNLN